jgi:hypothetical protein
MAKKINKVQIRHLKLKDYEELKSSMVAAYKDMEGSHWMEDHIARLLKKFPKGQLAAIVDGKVVGCALSLIVKSEDFEEDHTIWD